MTEEKRRAARIRHILLFAGLILQLPNPGNAAAPDLALTPATLSFKYQIGSALPATQTLQIKSTGTAITYAISADGPVPYGAQWISLSVFSGTTAGTVKVYVNPTGMPAGTYSATITVTPTDSTITARTVPVSLAVTSPPPLISANPAAPVLIDYKTGDANPTDQTVSVLTSGAALSATVTVSGGTWLSVTPTGSVVALVGMPGSVKVKINPAGLAPSTTAYVGKVTFSSAAASNKSVTVEIHLTVSAGVPTITTGGVWPAGVPAGSPDTTVTITGSNFFSTSRVKIGTNLLTPTVYNSTTMWVKIPAALLAAEVDLSLVISTPTASADSTGATFSVYGPEPKISAVVNAASYGASTVSPGEIIVIYGMALGPVDVVPFNSTAPPPLTLGANGAVTAVKIDGLDAPILYTSGTQISCIVPYGVSSSSGNDVDLVVTYNSLPSDPFTVTVADADPGVFVDSTGQAAIMNVADTGAMTMNTAKNAAAKGSAVSIYITGFGDTQCADTQTSTCPVTHPDEKAFILGTVTPTGNVGVTIGGQAATVLAAIAPEGSVAGLLQINVTVPDGAPTGAAVAVVVSVGSANSSKQTVTMAVK